MRLRFAPSPTGYIHVGNVRTALFNFLHSKKHNGKFILRIEDTDIERSTKEYEESLLKSIKWLGLSWDEGPDVDGEFGPYRQSERTDIYKKYALKLMEEGKAYYCFCTPEELEVEREKARKAGQPYKYSGKCRNIPPEEGEKRVKNGEKAVIRFKMPQEKDFKYKDLIRGEISFDLNLFGDFVIIRSNGLPSYNYAVVIDDHFMKITDIIRGEDHISNTPKQIKLYEAFGWTPPNFGHLSMVLGPDGSPLSKRHGATSLIQFDEMGYLPEALLNYLAMLGWAPPEEREILTLKELIELFDITKVSKSGAIFDYNKLNWANRKHIQALSEEELIIRGERFLKDENIMESFSTLGDKEKEWFIKAVKSIKSNITVLTDLPIELNIFFEYKIDKEAFEELKEESGKKVLNLLYKTFKDKGKITVKDIFDFIKTAKNKGIKGKELFHPMRVIFTGQGSGVELDKFLEIIGSGDNLSLNKKPLSLFERLEKAINIINK
jgi:glutamyl-tRNA synthetase